MNLKLLVFTFKTDVPLKDGALKLRGYIGNMFPKYQILDHHIKCVGYLYTYPRVQYKVLGGTPLILSIQEGAEVLKEISAILKIYSSVKHI